jgi:alpha-D-xyloside xylohydrolase
MEGALNVRRKMFSINYSEMRRAVQCVSSIGTLAICSSLLAAPVQLVGQGRVSPSISIVQTAQGFTAKIGDESLRVTVCDDDVIHLVAGPGDPAASSPVQPWMLDASKSCPGAKFQFAQDDKNASLTTTALKVEFSLKNGNLTYKDSQGKSLLREGNNEPRTYEKAEVNGEPTYHVTDRFSPDFTEALYGLGQHQNGMFNYRGATIELGQNNTDVAIPLLVSSKGYAVMWNTASMSYFDNRFPTELSFSSMAGDAVDYYLIYGPELDQVIHQYRNLTGHTPLFPKWAYGFFQSKDRYVSQQEVLDVAKRYRAEHIPIDGIVQDWFWWQKEGDPVFNRNFPDVRGELKTLHDEHFHAMLSVWGLFDPDSENFKKLSAKHFDIYDAHVYDATNPAARDFYWNNLAGKLFDMGWDAFWLDSAEPEESWPHGGDAILRDKKLSIGSGARYTNIFPLVHTGGVQEHWKQTTDQKRVFLLTRSAFLGQQRNGTTTWSGDIYSTYMNLQRQVPAGLNFALSGNPYWTTDIGGYFQPFNRPPNDPDYQKLYARWFEFGAFCPVFRTHGHRDHNEMWTYDKVEPILLKYDKLRYRLMPYIYSLAWRVTNEDYTIQRPLVMDWRGDEKTWNIGDQFMFGPALMVNPVMREGATRRDVYLPASPVWYDFWTGDAVAGRGWIEADAPLDRIPLYVRAGSIVPLGPEIEYADENPGGPIELRVYTGADGSFNLYNDEGNNYDYQKGMHSVIPIRWDEAAKTLTIGGREGEYPGMPKERRFNIVWVGRDHGAGEALESRADKTVRYSGEAVSVRR